MIWRTCGSESASSARSAYSTRAVGFCGPTDTTPSAVLRVGVVADLAEPAGQLGGRAERGHPIAPDQPGDRRVVDARLLRQLALRHLLGLELGSKPLVECAAVLGRHARLGLGSGARCAGSTGVSDAHGARAQSPVRTGARPVRAAPRVCVGSGAVAWRCRGVVRSGEPDAPGPSDPAGPPGRQVAGAAPRSAATARPVRVGSAKPRTGSSRSR